MSDARQLCPELWEENQRLQSLVELARTLADPGLTLDAKLQRAVEVLAQLARAERASLMVVEKDRLVVRAATDPRIIGLATPLSESTISTEVLRSGRSVYAKDISDSSFARVCRQGDQSNYRTGSLISLPLAVDQEVVGVLNLADKAGADFFSQEDLTLAQDTARQVANLIHFSVLHARLQEAYQELARTQQAKEDLMYMIFHDMKAPLTGVKEVMRLLGQPEALTPEERQQYLALAEGDLEHLWRRITNLLDLNRMDNDTLPVNPVELDLAALAREAASCLAAVAQVREVEIQVEAPAPVELEGDEDLVERILINLLFNALKFSSPEEGGGGRVLLRVRRQDGDALVEVEDTGPGVDPELGDDIFQRFAQGRPTRGSTGLGLYFCRRAAELLGGEVSYQNLPAGGACFWLRLPAPEEG